MPKRYLSVQNKNNENKQQQQSIANSTRSATKRASTNDPVPAKKAKTEEENFNKENIPVGLRNELQSPLINNPVLPILHGSGLLKPSAYDDDESSTSSVNDDDSNDEVGNQQQEPISSIADNDNAGEDHPTNKQYLIYTSRDPAKDAYVISKTARYWSLKYRKDLRHVIPDLYNMYIHSDFECYGELEVVENCLLDLTKTLFFTQIGIVQTGKTAERVNYPLGFRRLEALTILLEYTDGISGIDDGDRFYDILRVIGACYVTILRGLFPKVMFKKIETNDVDLQKKLKKISRQLPNLKQVLEHALIIGHQFLTIADVCSAYTKVLQMVYCNWLFVMEKVSVDLNGSSNQLSENLWKALRHAATIDPNTVERGGRESFHFLKELRSYKEQYGLGGHAHDLSKWSQSDRAQYSFGRYNPMNHFWFLN